MHNNRKKFSILQKKEKNFNSTREKSSPNRDG